MDSSFDSFVIKGNNLASIDFKKNSLNSNS
jgi:hypothetical protein